ncbi:30S ribosomal protein S20 [Spiroplasma endosymbiont of Amphibalanus improvisus]|uniref:30S ribosomal protein S20 n=1 Tax=Spiroplasma endosymbiont of Amphibalanus improvisus TaxID=3066327 RepID=UPI00313C0FAA
MANIKSKIKRIKTNEKQRINNKAVKTKTRNLYRQAMEAKTKKTENALELIQKASRQLDVACSKGVFHRNKVANLKSKLNKK